MDLFRNKIWGKGAWLCHCCNTEIRFSAGRGWHHYTRNENWTDGRPYDYAADT